MLPRPALFAGIYRPDAKILRFLSVILLSGIAFGLYRGIQDNYLAEIMKISPFERGIVEFFREIPGLLVVFILAILYRHSATTIFKIGTALMLGGISGLFLTSASPFFHTKVIVVIFTVFFSLGEHIVMPVRTTICLDLARREKAGASLGITSAITSLGQITGFLLVTALFFVIARMGFSRTDLLGFRLVFGISSGLMIASTLTVLALRDASTVEKRPMRRFYFARKFYKFYMLEVFYGARKQIFLTFAPYALILLYGADPSIMALLYAVCALFGIICGPLIGVLIDRIGYKTVMVGDTLILIVVCFLYGFAHRLFPKNIAFMVVCVNFVLDSIISMGALAANVYVQRIAANQEEVTATLSTGISVNHVISILIALLGGWIWRETGIEVLFSLSAFLGLINSIYAATIRKSDELRS